MARRFRRKRTQIWMPTYGNVNDPDELDSVIGTAGAVNVLQDGSTTVDAFPCTFDDTQSAYATQFGPVQNTLHDIVSGQEWRLLRVVGKFHASFGGLSGGQDPTFYPPPAAEVALGLIVLRTDEEGNIQADINEVNPLAQESANDPWIFRRKWVLSSCIYNPPSASSSNPIGYSLNTIAGAMFEAGKRWPVTTSGYGSVADGPHIDQKTRRLIGREERLYWMIAARMWDPSKLISSTGGLTAPGSIFFNLDNRFVGRLSSRMGNRNNASR